MDPAALIEAARSHRTRSYAPYSKFRAGAAVSTRDNGMIGGAIVENVSLGLAMCPERVAMFAAVAADDRPTALALVAPSTGDTLTWPCGACLQVALELGGPDLAVHVSGTDEADEIRSSTVGALLPNGPRVEH